MAVYMATLANGGTRVTPHLLKAIDDGSGWHLVAPPPPQSRIDIAPEKLQAIRDGLWMVVNAAGTGGRARIAGKDVAGKTGSAHAPEESPLWSVKKIAGYLAPFLATRGWQSSGHEHSQIFWGLPLSLFEGTDSSGNGAGAGTGRHLVFWDV